MRLIVLEGPAAQRDYEVVRPRVTIGRSPECDIVVFDPQVSRLHAELRHSAVGYAIASLQAANPVIVNDRFVEQPRTLKNGDLLVLGGVLLEVRVEPPPTAAPPRPRATAPARSTPDVRDGGAAGAPRSAAADWTGGRGRPPGQPRPVGPPAVRPGGAWSPASRPAADQAEPITDQAESSTDQAEPITDQAEPSTDQADVRSPGQHAAARGPGARPSGDRPGSTESPGRQAAPAQPPARPVPAASSPVPPVARPASPAAQLGPDVTQPGLAACDLLRTTAHRLREATRRFGGADPAPADVKVAAIDASAVALDAIVAEHEALGGDDELARLSALLSERLGNQTDIRALYRLGAETRALIAWTRIARHSISEAGKLATALNLS